MEERGLWRMITGRYVGKDWEEERWKKKYKMCILSYNTNYVTYNLKLSLAVLKHQKQDKKEMNVEQRENK